MSCPSSRLLFRQTRSHIFQRLRLMCLTRCSTLHNLLFPQMLSRMWHRISCRFSLPPMTEALSNLASIFWFSSPAKHGRKYSNGESVFVSYRNTLLTPTRSKA